MTVIVESEAAIGGGKVEVGVGVEAVLLMTRGGMAEGIEEVVILMKEGRRDRLLIVGKSRSMH